MDFESGVLPVSRFVGRATTTSPEDLESRLRHAVVRAESGELVGLLLVEVRSLTGGPLSEDSIDELFGELAAAARLVDFVGLVRPGLFVVLEPELAFRSDAWETSERVLASLERHGTAFEAHLGLAFTSRECIGAREFFLRAEAELDDARENGNWSARRPLAGLRDPLDARKADRDARPREESRREAPWRHAGG